MRSSLFTRHVRRGFRPLVVERLEARVVPSFSAPRAFDVGTSPRAVAMSDLNGDGAQDLAVANWGSNDLSVLLGRGDGTFHPARSFRTGGTLPESIAVGSSTAMVSLTSPWRTPTAMW